ncbi:hypothetical protein [Bacillus sp. Marseille-P3661]|uniref:hypothetical protein n=1 Tax=Bacillus sp. Marseille-P3661 TaxID=1936234 RepID=UPI000C8596EA|nr:hypothetical protein [Bacillus sp. Marseille-P3661]
MDKQRTERISIRINGKEKNLLSEDELNQEIAVASESVHDEPGEFEKTYVLDNENDEDFQTNIIDFEEVRLERGYNKTIKKRKFTSLPPPRHKLPKKKKRHTPLFKHRPAFSASKKMLAALISAIIIGTGFGYIVLSLFTDISDSTEPPRGNVQQAVAPPNPSVESNQPSQTASTAGAGITEIEAMGVQVIQGGAFSSVEAANQFAAKLTTNGQAAVIVPESNPVLMFIGIGTNSTEIGAISEYYKEQGQEIYVKSVKTSSVDAKLIDESYTSFIHNGQDLFKSLITLSTQAFTASKVDDNSWSSLEQSYKNWNGAIPNELPDSLTAFSGSITNAYQALSAYRSSLDEGQLWKSQQALLEGYIAYDQWVKNSKNE